MTPSQRQKYHDKICKILNATYDDSIGNEPKQTGALLQLLEEVRAEALNEVKAKLDSEFDSPYWNVGDVSFIVDAAFEDVLEGVATATETCGDAAGRGGCKNPAAESHACPFQQEIHDSQDEEYCNCCSDCRHECAMDI